MYWLRIEELNAEQTKKLLCINKIDTSVAECLCNAGFNGKMLASFRRQDYYRFFVDHQVQFFNCIETAIDLLHIRDKFRFGAIFDENSKFLALIDASK